MWKDVHNFEGRYQVSNLGNVRSLRFCTKSGSVSYTTLKPILTKGYVKVNLYRGDGIKYQYMISHLVIQAFAPNIFQDSLRLIYKDCDTTNCKLSNLIVPQGSYEEWRSIPGYCSNYQVSNFGRVRSLASSDSKYKLLRQSEDRDGYSCLSISDVNGRRRKVKVHRLVALAFIPNLNKKPTVNHIDGNKWNNCVTNLEWATYREQNIHAVSNNLRSSQSVHVMCIETKQEFPSKRSAETTLGLPKNSVARCISTGKPINGYTFKETRRIVHKSPKRLF